MVMRAVHVVSLLVGCKHAERVCAVERAGGLGRHEVCIDCGAWREPDGMWTRPAIIEQVARTGVEGEPKPPKPEASTVEVEGVQVTPIRDGGVSLVVSVHGEPRSWTYLPAMQAAQVAHAILQAAGASTEGTPRPEAFAMSHGSEHSVGPPETDSGAPLRGMVHELIALSMRPLVALGGARAVLAMLLEASPGETMQAALAMARKWARIIDEDFAEYERASSAVNGGAEPAGDAAP